MITINHYRRVTLLTLLGSWALFAGLFILFLFLKNYVDDHLIGLLASMFLSFLFIACLTGPAVTTVIATVRLVLNESGKLRRYVTSGILAVLFGMVIFLLTISPLGISDQPAGGTLLQLWWRILSNGVPLAFIAGVTLVVLLAEFLLQRRIQPKGGYHSSTRS